MSTPAKTREQLIAEATERQAAGLRRSAQLAEGRPVPPRDSAELAHAHQIEASAATMRAKGYAVVSIGNVAGVLAQVRVTGPRPATWQGDDLADMQHEAPPYVQFDDYVLAWHEQYNE